MLKTKFLGKKNALVSQRMHSLNNIQINIPRFRDINPCLA